MTVSEELNEHADQPGAGEPAPEVGPASGGPGASDLLAQPKGRREKEAKAPPETPSSRILKTFLSKPPQALFKERMKREGKIEDYHRIWAEVRASGKSAATAGQVVRQQLGYLGPKGEREMAHQAINAIGLDERDRKAAESQRNRWAARRKETFDQAHARLPMIAPIDVDMAWVQSHPANIRKARRPEGEDGPLLLTVDDITQVNGGAPSQRAINILQNWINTPTDMLKHLMPELRKHSAKGDDSKSVSNAVVDNGLEDIDRVLEQIG